MTYVLRPRNQRLQPLEVSYHGWSFVLDNINPQFRLSLHRSRRPALVHNLKSQDGFQVTKREALLMSAFFRQNTAALESRWPLVDEFCEWAEKSNGFSIN